MNAKIPIGMSLVNSGLTDEREVYDFIARNIQGAEAYFRAPRLGGVAAAGLEFYLIVSTLAANVATIASAIWMAYDRFFAHKKSHEEDTGIYVAITRPDGTVIDIWLERDTVDKQDFETRLQLIIEEAHDPQMRPAHEQTIRQLKSSGKWRAFYR
jgi:hypothetical protein